MVNSTALQKLFIKSQYTVIYQQNKVNMYMYVPFKMCIVHNRDNMYM